MDIIKFKPVYQKRVWGGRNLERKLNRKLPGDGPYGESWELVDRPEAQSVDLKSGLTLRELLKCKAEAIMGPDYDPSTPFPVLVKWLDCSQRLSLQVHPPADVASELQGEPKTECWYIADADNDAALIVGLKADVSRNQLEQAIAEEDLEPLIHKFTVRSGQAMLLKAGRLHAIDAGNLILEIHQNSDTTYRVYDWGRTGLDGKPRTLHVDKSLKSIDFNDIEPYPQPEFTEPGQKIIADCPEFRIRQINLPKGKQLSFEVYDQPRVLSLVTGILVDNMGNQRINMSENILIPYSCAACFTAVSESRVIVTDCFV